MPDVSAMVLFLGASLALLLTPGPAVLYLVSRSVDQGMAAGLLTAAGLVAGGAVHVLAAALGVSALMAASPAALGALTWAGAGYLAWLGWGEWTRRGEPGPVGGLPGQRGIELVRQGLLVNLLNPKAVLFFLAFLPQFVQEGGWDPRLQMLALGGIFLSLALCTDSGWVLASHRLGRRLEAEGRVRRRVSAAIYFGLAAAAIWPRG